MEQVGEQKTTITMETELDSGIVVAFISALIGLDAEDIA